MRARTKDIANKFNCWGSPVQPIDYHKAHNTGYSTQPIAIRHFILLINTADLTFNQHLKATLK